MINKFKSNKLISLILLIMCGIMIFNPITYAKSCLNGISVWAFKVLPLMFPFFIITKLISNLNSPKKNFMDKFFNKLYNAPNGSFLTFFLSVLSGYPMGAKLICSLYDGNYVSSEEAKKMMSFCSVSGPMFTVGTVGVMMFHSFSAGIIILSSNILAGLINGFLYRGKKNKRVNLVPQMATIKQDFSQVIYDSLVSILLVGAYIVTSFILIDILNNLKIISLLSNTICGVFNIGTHQDIVQSILNGTIEMTRGIFDLSLTTTPLKIKTIIASFLISLGGVSIFLQSLGFLEKLKIKPKILILQKITQSLIALVISIPLSYLFL